MSARKKSPPRHLLWPGKSVGLNHFDAWANLAMGLMPKGTIIIKLCICPCEISFIEPMQGRGRRKSICWLRVCTPVGVVPKNYCQKLFASNKEMDIFSVKSLNKSFILKYILTLNISLWDIGSSQMCCFLKIFLQHCKTTARIKTNVQQVFYAFSRS